MVHKVVHKLSAQDLNNLTDCQGFVLESLFSFLLKSNTKACSVLSIPFFSFLMFQSTKLQNSVCKAFFPCSKTMSSPALLTEAIS